MSATDRAEQDLCRRVARQEQDPLGVPLSNAELIAGGIVALKLGARFRVPVSLYWETAKALGMELERLRGAA